MPERIGYTVTGAAEALDVSRITIYRRMQDGTLPYSMVGGLRIIAAGDLRALLERHRVTKPEPARPEPEPPAQPVRRLRRRRVVR